MPLCKDIHRDNEVQVRLDKCPDWEPRYNEVSPAIFRNRQDMTS
jgi:hypothetical protein